MKKSVLYILAAIIIFFGLAFYDRLWRTDTVIPATVVSVTARDDTGGPETWHIIARTGAAEVALEPLQARPDLAPDDPLCLTEITRENSTVQYRIAPGGTVC